jgi:hypothetical protein
VAKVPDEDGKSNADAGPSLLAERLAGLTVPLEPDLRTQELAAQAVDVWFDAWAAAVERMTVHPFGARPFHRFPSDAPTTQLLVELHRLAVLAVGVANTGVGTIRPGSLRFLDEMLGATFESSLQAEVKISKEKLGGVARVARAQAVLDAALRARQTAGLVLGTFPSAGTHPLGALLDEALYVASVGAALGDPVMARAHDVLRTIDVQHSKGLLPLEDVTLSHAAFTQRGTPAKVLRSKAAIVQFFAGLGPRTDAHREELKPGLAVLHVAIAHGRRNGAQCFDVLTQCREEVRTGRKHEDVLLWVIGRALALFGHDGDTPQAQPRVAAKRAARRARTEELQATDERAFVSWVKGAFTKVRPAEYLNYEVQEFRDLITRHDELREWVNADPKRRAKLSRSRKNAT